MDVMNFFNLFKGFATFFSFKMTANIESQAVMLETKVAGIFQKMKDIKMLLQEVQLELISLKNSKEYIEVKQFHKVCERKRKIDLPETLTASIKTRKMTELSKDTTETDNGSAYYSFNKNSGWISDPGTTNKNFTEENGYVVVYTDGACENNGKSNAKAGIGIWFGVNHPLNVSRPVQGKATNNTAEIQACTTALEILHREGIRKVRLKTDSQFTINCITQWINRWRKNNWKVATGADVKNKDELVKLDSIRNKMEHVDWVHIRGHQGERGNEEADKLARTGAILYKQTDF